MQLACLEQYVTLAPYAVEITQFLQKEGMKIGCSTSFIRSIVDVLEADAKKQGYIPRCVGCW